MVGSTSFFSATSSGRSDLEVRAPIEELYGSKEQYISVVRTSPEVLIRERHLLEVDLEVVIGNCAARYDESIASGSLLFLQTGNQ